MTENSDRELAEKIEQECHKYFTPVAAFATSRCEELIASYRLAVAQAALEKAAKGFDNLHWKLKTNEEAAGCVRALPPFAGNALAEHDAQLRAHLSHELFHEMGMDDEPVALETPGQLIARFRKAVEREMRLALKEKHDAGGSMLGAEK